MFSQRANTSKALRGLRIDTGRFSQHLPSYHDLSSSKTSPWGATHRFLPSPHRILRPSLSRLTILLLALTGILFLRQWDCLSLSRPEAPPTWTHFPLYSGYYNGVKRLVSYNQYFPENSINDPRSPRNPTSEGSRTTAHDGNSVSIPLHLRAFHPYPNYTSPSYLADHHPVKECYVDKDNRVPAPDIFVYPGVPQDMPHPIFGSYGELDLPEDVCFERYGRLGPYGWGYPREEGGLWTFDLNATEHEGIEELWRLSPKINYALADWGLAQKACYERNKARFKSKASSIAQTPLTDTGKKPVSRNALVLRAWTGYTWSDFEMASIRAMITELSLKSGGEYDVHILVDVKDTSIPIWASDEVYQETLAAFLPKEFWGITTLWSNNITRLYYPGPFENTVDNNSGQEMYGTYRSGHWALQWFSQQHPEYDFIWNWEMDVRYSGHYYDFFEKLGKWSKKQPRKGLWERSSKFWIPSVHGDYENFTTSVEEEIAASGTDPIWGPVKFANLGIAQTPPECRPNSTYHEDQYEWGVGEDADLIVFNPLFDPDKTIWFFRDDITGYDAKLPTPPRRSSVVTVSRLSKRLLTMMHKETYQYRHSAFPEMWPATCSLHHGLKAVYAPHPIYFDRQWPMDYMDQIFNRPVNKEQSIFGLGEHNFKGATFYFDATFAGALWRRWLGESENNEGGASAEIAGSGRMCLRSTLHHPIKME